MSCVRDRSLRPRPEKVEEAIKAVDSPKPEKAPPTKCRECKQLLDDPDLKIFQGDPADAVSVLISWWVNRVSTSMKNLKNP